MLATGKQKRRMVNSMNALKKPEGLGKVFLAGEYWEARGVMKRRETSQHQPSQNNPPTNVLPFFRQIFHTIEDQGPFKFEDTSTK
jgi:hypothetical protein